MASSPIWLETIGKVQFLLYYTKTASLFFHELAGHSVNVDKQTRENHSDHLSDSYTVKHLWM